MGGRSGCNRESVTELSGDRWGGGRSRSVGGGGLSRKMVEAGGAGDTRNKVTDRDIA